MIASETYLRSDSDTSPIPLTILLPEQTPFTMAAKPPPARIHALNDDALLLIFSINGNMFLDEYALHTTRATSLVCQRWRNLMLATPSLWARLLDIDLISFSEHYEWRKELMRRTGAALLWIKVDEVKKKQPADSSRAIGQFFFSLIRENWHRIQNLVDYLHATPTFHPTTWEPLSRPAPVLERFNMMWERTQPAQNTDPTPLAVLFSGSAPMLRDFCFLPYTIDERVPWLCQLRVMEFDNTYNIRHVLGILQSTPHLQELKIGGIKCLVIRSPLPIASLPHLRYLKYEGPPKQGAALLDHMEIPAQCLLNIPSSRDTFPMPANATEQQRLSITDTFVRCIQRYLRFRPPDRISLGYNGDLSITVSAPPTCSFSRCSTDTPFAVSIPLGNGSYDTDGPWPNLTKVALPELSSVTELCFESSRRINPTLSSFFGCFTSLKTITTECRSLGYLTALRNDIRGSDDSPIIFPLLDTIELDLLFNWYDARCYEVDSEVKEFIMQRIREGHAISRLHLVNHHLYDDPPILDALSKADGLTVWDDGVELTCGRVDRKNSSD